MQSSLKKTLSIISAIVNIVAGAIYVLISIYAILNCALNIGTPPLVSLLAWIIDIIIGALIVLFASISLLEKFRYKLSLSITLLVIFGLWFISAIISGGWLGAVLSLIAIGLKVAAMVVKDTTEEKSTNNQNKQVPLQSTLETKIEELKHYKELGIITDEQYEEAVKKAVSSIL